MKNKEYNMRLLKQLWYWCFGKPPPPYTPTRYILPEEAEEERIISLQMHYGDEPLYYVDPPEWPTEVELR